MFEQMGKAGMFGMFIPGTYIINDVQCYHLSTEVLVMYQSQTVREDMFIDFHKIEIVTYRWNSKNRYADNAD